MPDSASASGLSKVDSMIHLERADENFHRHVFVRHIQKMLNNAVGPLLDSHLNHLQNHQLGHNDIESLVPSIVDKVMASSEYLNLLASVTAEARKSVTELVHSNLNQRSHAGITHYLGSSGNLHFDSNNHHSRTRRHESSFSTHSNTTLDSSSGSISFFSDIFCCCCLFCDIVIVNHKLYLSSCLSPPLEEVKMIIANLMSRNSVETRLTAARVREFAERLEALPTADLLSSEFWADAKEGLEKSLADNDTSRVFKASPPPMTGEIYMILVSHLVNYFEAGISFKFDDGLSVSDPRVDINLKKQMFTDVMDSTFKLLKPTKRSAGNMTALHCLSIIDTRALWFEKWMLSHFGRAQSVQSILKAELTSELSNRFMLYVSSLTFPTTGASRDEVVVMDVEANEDENDRKILKNDLDYAHFLHVLIILSKLSLCSAGRKSFPIAIDDFVLGTFAKSPIGRDLTEFIGNRSSENWFTVDMFFCILIKLMCKCHDVCFSKFSNVEYSSQNTSLNLSQIICEVLQKMVLDDKCSDRLYKTNIFAELGLSVQNALESSGRSGVRKEGNHLVLINVGNVLSSIALNDKGRKILLLGKENGVVTLVATFVKNNLEASGSHVSLRVLAALIFFLRQLYRTCDGLLALEEYSLHSSLSRSIDNLKWFESLSDKSLSHEEWRSITMDNLLNFAGTPKGVLLLHQSGSMDPCVEHMFNRYQKKMQVSSCEKFGYGVLVSQVSTTKPGMAALIRTGLIKSFISNVWGLLEIDKPFGDQSIEIDDPASKKILSNLLKALSSFPGLSTILKMEAVDIETNEISLAGLIRKLVLVDRSIKPETLSNYHESHQAHFHVQESLLQLQSEAAIPFAALNVSHDVFVIDENSLLRHRILIETSLTGGCNERVLPTVSLNEDSLNQRMFSRFPVPKPYMPNISYEALEREADNSFDMLALEAGGLSAKELFVRIESFFVENVRRSSLLSTPFPLLARLLEKFMQLLRKVGIDKLASEGWSEIEHFAFRPESLDNEVESTTSDNINSLGIAVVIRYLKRILPNLHSTTSAADIWELLRRLRSLTSVSGTNDSSNVAAAAEDAFQSSVKLGRGSKLKNGSGDRSLQYDHNGFDWFSATIFAVFGGSVDRTHNFLNQFSRYLPSMFAWPMRSVRTAIVMQEMGGIPLIYSCSCYFVEAILEAELPSVASAFTLSGCTPSQITQRWMRECFWNVLNFPEIANYIASIILLGIDYQIYTCIAILRHAEKAVLHAARKGELILYLNHGGGISASLEDYKMANCLKYMHGLCEKYRVLIFDEMRSEVVH
ncbi:hypothetical protein HDU76_011390 [Blyttiomyces sp. JEL0837]|nr:hypothetical protein HDU76_011390 [Blyttiomyces sp. JEL0837]